MRTELPSPTRRARAGRQPLAISSSVRRGTVSMLVLVFGWWLLVDVLQVVPARTLPPLADVVSTFADLLVEPFAGRTLLGHACDSLTRWGLGIAVSLAVGAPLGLLMGWFRLVDAIVGPLFHAVRSIPPLAWIPLGILWLGTGLVTEVGLVVVAAFPPIVLNAHHGARTIDREIVWAARTTGAGSVRQLAYVVLPTELPQLLSGVRIALSNGLMAVIAAELISARSGLGFMIVRGQQDFQPDIILVGMLSIALVGLLADSLLKLLSRPLLRWRNIA